MGDVVGEKMKEVRREIIGDVVAPAGVGEFAPRGGLNLGGSICPLLDPAVIGVAAALADSSWKSGSSSDGKESSRSPSSLVWRSSTT